MQPLISALNIQTQTVQTQPAPRNTSEPCPLPACVAQEEHGDTVDGSIARTEPTSGECRTNWWVTAMTLLSEYAGVQLPKKYLPTQAGNSAISSNCYGLGNTPL